MSASLGLGLGLGGLSGAGVLSARPAMSRGHSVRRTLALADTATAAARRPASLYETLRVRETASVAEIKAAYRALAKRFHPDVAQPGSGPDFLEIQRAYATLSDTEARAQYDRSVRRVGLSGSPRFGSRRWETDQCW